MSDKILIHPNPFGIVGPMGPTGPQGPKGDKGDIGYKGDKGDRGEKGDQGARGPAGASGKSAKIKYATALFKEDNGKPRVEVETKGTEYERIFDFLFYNLKGIKGDQGIPGIPGTPGAPGQNGESAGIADATAKLETDTTNTSARVEVETSGPNTNKQFDFTFYNLKGKDGDPGRNGSDGKDGESAGIANATAKLQEDTNDTSSRVVVNTSGPNTNKQFDFTFYNLKGEKGDDGAPGKDGSIGKDGESAGIANATAKLQEDTNDTSSRVVVNTSGPNTNKQFDFTFYNLKGEKGDDGAPGQNGQPGAPGQNGTNGQDGKSAGFGKPIAKLEEDSVDTTTRVELNASGPDTAKIFDFTFYNLKGEDGSDGKDGESAGIANATAKLEKDTNDTSSRVVVNTSGPNTNKQFDFTFYNLKGEDGSDGKDGTNIRNAISETKEDNGETRAEVEFIDVPGQNSKDLKITFYNIKGKDGDPGKDGRDGLDGENGGNKYFRIITVDEDYEVTQEDLASDTIIRANKNGNQTITIVKPTEDSVIGFQITVRKTNGDWGTFTTILPGTGVTILPEDGDLLRRNGSSITFIYVGNGVYDVYGELP